MRRLTILRAATRLTRPAASFHGRRGPGAALTRQRVWDGGNGGNVITIDGMGMSKS